MNQVQTLSLQNLADVGLGLNRPECVLCTSDGAVTVSNWNGGVTRISPNGRTQHIVARNPPVELKPNGIALCEDGSFLLANLGDDGGIWRLAPDRSVEPFVTEIDGERIPPCNFVLPDTLGRVWMTVSTRATPRSLAYRPDVADGFIAVHVDGVTRILADGLGYTNEVQLHPSGDWLYVNETFARRLSRFRIARDGSLGPRSTVTEFGAGTFPDGLCFDEAGYAWVVSIVSNRVIRVAPDGQQQLLLEDSDDAHLERVERAFLDRTMGRPHLDKVSSQRLRSISSIAFGGDSRRTCYFGCLLNDRISSIDSPVAGIAPVHWNWRFSG